MIETRQACAHLTVVYETIKREDGAITGWWNCNDCETMFVQASLLNECLDAIVYHRKGSRGASPRVASSWFLNLLKRHGRVKPVEGEDLDAFVRPEVE